MAYIRKLPSGKWQATVKHPSGKRYTKTDPLRRVVAEWASDLETQVRRGEFIDPNAGKMTLGQWWEKWLETRRVEQATEAKTESHWRVHVEPAFGTWPLASIQSWDVEAWVTRQVKKGVGEETTAATLRLLSQLLAAAVRHKIIRANPAADVRAPTPAGHVDRIFEHDEAERFLTFITKADHTAKVPRGEKLPRVADFENRVFVKTMLDAGLRWEEVAGLHVFRVDLMRRRFRVQEVLQRDGTLKDKPKSPASERFVPMTDELVELYSRLLAGKDRADLVYTRDGKELDYSNWLKRVWKPAVKAAELDLPLPTPHDCRHSYGSWLADEGVPPHEIAALMGHGSLRSAERYIHASKRRHERARAALGARGAHGRSGNEEGPGPLEAGSGA